LILTNKIKDTSFTIIDTETTGLYPKAGDRISEIGVLRIKNGKKEGELNTLVNPGKPIPKISEKITGITDEMVKDAPSFKEIQNELIDLMDNSVLIFHNAVFDLAFLHHEIDKPNFLPIPNPVIDTLLLTRKHFNFTSNALEKLAPVINANTAGMHRAMADVLVTKELFEYILKNLPKDISPETVSDFLKLQGGDVNYLGSIGFKVPEIISNALSTKNILRIRYLSKNGDETVREIEPLTIRKNEDKLYLIGFCMLTNKRRTFRMDRIKKMKVLIEE
jgi:DNA polymerase III epsilon subunit family exonuclease